MNQLRTMMLLAAMTALFMGVGYMVAGQTGAVIALVVAAATNLFSFWNADKMVLAAHRAREVDENSAPDFVALVRDLAVQAGLPTPRVYVIDNPQPNAFATGRDPAHAAVAATTGLLNMLDRDEIAGVMAHELAHVQFRDTLTMTVTATIAGAISMLGNFFMFFSPRDTRDNPVGVVGALFSVLVAPFAAMIIQMAVSRTREYAADRRGAEISGKPLALASALRKISGAAQAIENPDAEANPATAHLFIVNPLSGARFDNLFSTHPAPENRIAALADIAAEMDAASAGSWGRAAAPKGPWS